MPDGRPRLEAPPRPNYPPGLCITPKSPDTPTIRCNEPARFYPSGWHCADHRPRRTRTTTKENP